MAARFWVGGAGTWDASDTTHWSATSGGAGGASVPGVNDTVTIDASSGTGTITVNTDFNITSLTCGAMGAGVGTPMTLDFSANNNSPTMSTFSGTGTGFRTINMGSGTWTLNGNNTTIWTTSTTTNLTLNAGTSTIVCNYSGSTGTRTIVTGGSSAFGINNLNVTAGTDTLTISSTFFINGNLDFTGFTGAWASNTGSIAGNLTCGAGMTTNAGNSTITFTATSSKTITTNGVALQRSFIFNGVGGTWTLQDSLNLSVTASIITLTNGTFNANNFNVTCGTFTSSNSNTRVLSMGSGTWTLTGNNTSIWNTGTTAGLTVSGSANIVCSYSGSVGTRIFSPGGLTVFSNNIGTLQVTAGTDTFSLTGTSTDFRSIDFTGFSGTLTAAGTTVNIRGSLTFSTGMTMSATAAFVFTGTGSGGTITSNGKAFASNITFNQSGATWILGDDVRTGSSNTVTLTAGTFNTNNKNVSVGLFSSSNSNTRTITMGSGTWTLTGTGTVWDTGTSINLTVTSVGSVLVINDASATGKTFSGGGIRIGSLSLTGDNITIAGNNTFSSIAFNNAGLTNGTIMTAGSTTTVGELSSNGSLGVLAKISSSSAGTPWTIKSDATQVTLPYVSLQDSTASPAGVFYAIHSLNVSGNTNWNFINTRLHTTNRLRATTTRLKVARDFGSNLLLDGTTGNIAATAIPNLGSGGTVAIWYKATGTGQLISNSTGTNDRFAITVTSTGALRGTYFNVSNLGPKETTASKLNQWTLCTYSYDGTNGKMYVNGSPSNTGTTAASTAHTGLFTIGARYAGAGFLPGEIAAVWVWDRALNDTEVSDLYNKGIVPKNNLKGEWLFNEGSGTTAVDTSGNGNNGTITGAVYTSDAPTPITIPRLTATSRLPASIIDG